MCGRLFATSDLCTYAPHTCVCVFLICIEVNMLILRQSWYWSPNSGIFVCSWGIHCLRRWFLREDRVCVVHISPKRWRQHRNSVLEMIHWSKPVDSSPTQHTEIQVQFSPDHSSIHFLSFPITVIFLFAFRETRKEEKKSLGNWRIPFHCIYTYINSFWKGKCHLKFLYLRKRDYFNLVRVLFFQGSRWLMIQKNPKFYFNFMRVGHHHRWHIFQMDDILHLNHTFQIDQLETSFLVYTKKAQLNVLNSK